MEHSVEKQFYDLLTSRRAANVSRWGEQSALVLQAVLMEEVGEVARALLEGKADHLRSEIIDTAAVLLELFEKAEHYCSQVIKAIPHKGENDGKG